MKRWKDKEWRKVRESVNIKKKNKWMLKTIIGNWKEKKDNDVNANVA